MPDALDVDPDRLRMKPCVGRRWIARSCRVLVLCLCPHTQAFADQQITIRFATFNASLYRDSLGQLKKDRPRTPSVQPLSGIQVVLLGSSPRGDFHRIVKLAGNRHTAWLVPFFSLAGVNKAE